MPQEEWIKYQGKLWRDAVAQGKPVQLGIPGIDDFERRRVAAQAQMRGG